MAPTLVLVGMLGLATMVTCAATVRTLLAGSALGVGLVALALLAPLVGL